MATRQMLKELARADLLHDCKIYKTQCSEVTYRLADDKELEYYRDLANKKKRANQRQERKGVGI